MGPAPVHLDPERCFPDRELASRVAVPAHRRACPAFLPAEVPGVRPACWTSSPDRLTMAPTGTAATQAFWSGLSSEYRPLVKALSTAIRRGLDRRYAEGVMWGQLAWFVPLSVYPAGYHVLLGAPLPLCSVAVTRRHVALHLMGLACQGDLRDWFEQAWRATGQRLDMGRGCVRIRTLAEVPLELVTEVIRRQSVAALIAGYETARGLRTSPPDRSAPRTRKQTSSRAKVTRRPSAPAGPPRRGSRPVDPVRPRSTPRSPGPIASATPAADSRAGSPSNENPRTGKSSRGATGSGRRVSDPPQPAKVPRAAQPSRSVSRSERVGNGRRSPRGGHPRPPISSDS